MSESWLVHLANIENKITNNYDKKANEFDSFKQTQYLPYQKSQMDIKSVSREAITGRVKLLEKYLIAVDEFNKGSWITAQSKFRSTVLEEFCGYLFKDLSVIKRYSLGFFNKGIYAGMRIDQTGNPKFETKDVDFSIGKDVEFEISNSKEKIVVPIVAIECKTYIDKTMFSEAQFTAQKFKGSVPGVNVVVIAETNAISLKEIPSQSPIDQVYILRGRVKEALDPNVVWQFYNDIKESLEKIDIKGQIKLPGTLFLK